MNNDLISRSKTIEELNYLKHIGYDNSGVMKLQNMEIQRCISVIEDAPAVDLFCSYLSDGEVRQPCVEGPCEHERPQGEWKEDAFSIICPFCGMTIEDEVRWLYPDNFDLNFCPNCGKKLRWKGEEE